MDNFSLSGDDDDGYTTLMELTDRNSYDSSSFLNSDDEDDQYNDFEHDIPSFVRDETLVSDDEYDDPLLFGIDDDDDMNLPNTNENDEIIVTTTTPITPPQIFLKKPFDTNSKIHVPEPSPELKIIDGNIKMPDFVFNNNNDDDDGLFLIKKRTSLSHGQYEIEKIDDDEENTSEITSPIAYDFGEDSVVTKKILSPPSTSFKKVEQPRPAINHQLEFGSYSSNKEIIVISDDEDEDEDEDDDEEEEEEEEEEDEKKTEVSSRSNKVMNLMDDASYQLLPHQTEEEEEEKGGGSEFGLQGNPITSVLERNSSSPPRKDILIILSNQSSKTKRRGSLRVGKLEPVFHDDDINRKGKFILDFKLFCERGDNKKKFDADVMKKPISDMIENRFNEGLPFDWENVRHVVFAREVKVTKSVKKFDISHNHRYRCEKGKNNFQNLTVSWPKNSFLFQNSETIDLCLKSETEEKKVFELKIPYINQNFRKANEGHRKVTCPLLEVIIVTEDKRYMIFSVFYLKYDFQMVFLNNDNNNNNITGTSSSSCFTPKSYVFSKIVQSDSLRNISRLLRYGVERGKKSNKRRTNTTTFIHEMNNNNNNNNIVRPIPVRKFILDYLFEERCFYYGSWGKIHKPERETPVTKLNKLPRKKKKKHGKRPKRMIRRKKRKKNIRQQHILPPPPPPPPPLRRRKKQQQQQQQQQLLSYAHKRKKKEVVIIIDDSDEEKDEGDDGDENDDVIILGKRKRVENKNLWGDEDFEFEFFVQGNEQTPYIVKKNRKIL